MRFYLTVLLMLASLVHSQAYSLSEQLLQRAEALRNWAIKEKEVKQQLNRDEFLALADEGASVSNSDRIRDAYVLADFLFSKYTVLAQAPSSAGNSSLLPLQTLGDLKWKHELRIDRNLRDVLPLLHKEVWNDQYVTRFLFSTYANPRQAKIGGILVRWAERLNRQENEIHRLIQATSDTLDPQFEEKLNLAQWEDEVLQSRLFQLGKKLREAITFAESQAKRNPAPLTFEEVEKTFAELGQELRAQLSGGENKSAVYQVSSPLQASLDLEQMAGVDAFYNGQKIGVSQEVSALAEYRDIATIQYVAAGAAYLRRLRALPLPKTTHIEKIKQVFQKPSVSRLDPRREAIERLWQTFFENAEDCQSQLTK